MVGRDLGDDIGPLGGRDCTVEYLHRVPRFLAAQCSGVHTGRSAIRALLSDQAASRLFRLRSAAVFSWPQAASMSRPRGVRTGAEMPDSKTMFEKALIRSSLEHS